MPYAPAVVERTMKVQEVLEQATHHATLAARRYDAVDPDNRLVAAELEARWNAALQRVAELEGRLTTQGRVAPRSVPAVDRDTLGEGGSDHRTGGHPARGGADGRDLRIVRGE